MRRIAAILGVVLPLTAHAQDHPDIVTWQMLNSLVVPVAVQLDGQGSVRASVTSAWPKDNLTGTTGTLSVWVRMPPNTAGPLLNLYSNSVSSECRNIGGVNEGVAGVSAGFDGSANLSAQLALNKYGCEDIFATLDRGYTWHCYGPTGQWPWPCLPQLQSGAQDIRNVGGLSWHRLWFSWNSLAGGPSPGAPPHTMQLGVDATPFVLLGVPYDFGDGYAGYIDQPEADNPFVISTTFWQIITILDGMPWAVADFWLDFQTEMDWMAVKNRLLFQNPGPSGQGDGIAHYLGLRGERPLSGRIPDIFIRGTPTDIWNNVMVKWGCNFGGGPATRYESNGTPPERITGPNSNLFNLAQSIGGDAALGFQVATGEFPPGLDWPDPSQCD